MEIPTEVFGIFPQTQPTNTTCVHTCIAMAMGVPVADVIKRYGEEGLNQARLISILSECDFLFNPLQNGMLVFESWYFATVPSLNARGGFHEVLLHWTYKEGFYVLDPNLATRYLSNGSDLLSWTDLIAFQQGFGHLPGEKCYA